MKVNMNTDCRVRLTPYGERLYREWHAALKITVNPPLDGLTMCLWELMNIFGPGCYMGNPRHPIFFGNEIEVLA